MRPAVRLAAMVAWLLMVAACAALPEGVTPVPDGTAQLTLPSGRVVPVDPDMLEYTGRARLTRADGSEYDGEWLRGRPHGHGTAIEAGGATYSGSWYEGARHGEGELAMPDGGRYVGEFQHGERAGIGTLQNASGVYYGDWESDVPHGDGVFEGADGARYEGAWHYGQRFGYGVFSAPGGGAYAGDWAGDEPHGFGRLQTPEGSQYAGEWRNGRQHGYGRAEGPPGLVYEGTWVDGRKQGFGREVRPDGTEYEGEWHDGKRHGQGRETHPDGSVHEGAFELNQVLGPGSRTDSDGIRITGMWNQDTVSSGLIELPSGLTYAGPLYSRAGTVASPRLLEWLTEAAERGDPHAQLLLGSLYLDMDQPAPDLDEARRWLERSAGAGIAEAQYRLALTYDPADPSKTAALLAEAAQREHTGADESLGYYYQSGLGVPRDLGRSITHYERAVAAGSNHARNNLAWLLATTSDQRYRDAERALELIRPIALYYGDWQYLDTLAVAWAAAGDFDQAVSVAEQAVTAAQHDPDAGAADLAALQRRLEEFRNGQPHVDEP
jgi:TPR repeat protein